MKSRIKIAKISLSIATMLFGLLGIVNAQNNEPTDARKRQIDIEGVPASEIAIPNIDHKARKPAVNDWDPQLTENKKPLPRNAYYQDSSKMQKKKEDKVMDRMKEKAQEDLEDQERTMKIRRQQHQRERGVAP